MAWAWAAHARHNMAAARRPTRAPLRGTRVDRAKRWSMTHPSVELQGEKPADPRLPTRGAAVIPPIGMEVPPLTRRDEISHPYGGYARHAPPVRATGRGAGRSH